MKIHLTKTASIILLSLCIIVSSKGSGEDDSSAKKQLQAVAHDPKLIDGSKTAHSGLDRPSNPAPVIVPIVQKSSQTVTGSGASDLARQQAAIKASNDSVTVNRARDEAAIARYKASGPAPGVPVKPAPPPPAPPVQPKTKPSGSVPTGGH